MKRIHTAILGAVLAVALPGCPEEQVTHTRVVAAPEAPAAPAAPSASPLAPAVPAVPMAGRDSEVPPPPKPTGDDGLTWKLPAGWTQQLSGGIRYATLKPPGQTAIDASVVVLAGPAGGEEANVNRWRGQIGLPPLDTAGLATLRQTTKTKVGPVSLFDFASEGAKQTRIVAAIAAVGDNTWFFKMLGDSDQVGAALPAFNQLVASLQKP